jgi:hypothetical protein
VSVSELGVEQSHAKSTLSRLAECLQGRQQLTSRPLPQGAIRVRSAHSCIPQNECRECVGGGLCGSTHGDNKGAEGKPPTSRGTTLPDGRYGTLVPCSGCM